VFNPTSANLRSASYGRQCSKLPNRLDVSTAFRDFSMPFHTLVLIYGIHYHQLAGLFSFSYLIAI